MGSQTLSVVLLVSTLSVCIFAEYRISHGFNDDINWVTFEEGKRISQAEQKPLMLLIHKSWCGACKALKPQVTQSKDIEEESAHFVMVNTEDDEEPVGSEFSPDGGYIPRVLFLSPEGEVVKHLYNEEGHGSYKYYYPTAEHLASGMKRARAHFDKTDSKRGGEL